MLRLELIHFQALGEALTGEAVWSNSQIHFTSSSKFEHHKTNNCSARPTRQPPRQAPPNKVAHDSNLDMN